ncbi:MAG: PspA/IM30 family protein, partial [Microthrixaceae bacterium]|nr:PspA/IM30 family protein [Microthrixaceae bacterium]
RKGNAGDAEKFTSAAEAFATQLISKEAEVENLKTMALNAAQASDQAKAAVQQNSRVLQQKLSERQKLLSQLDQAKMQEQMNTAMSSLSETVGQDVPTLEEVRDKIENRYAKAKGAAEVQGLSVESKMIEVEQASVNFEAQARLSELRSKLGLTDAAGSTDTPAEQPAAPEATEPAAAESTPTETGEAPA